VDPTAVCEGKTASPMEIALEKENEEMLCLLAKFTEMPDLCKLFYLSKLMHKGRDNLGEKAKAREDFQKILSSLPVQLVDTTSVRECGNLLQDAVLGGKTDFVRILLEFGADPLANTKDKEATSMEIAVEQDNFEVLIILLAGFAGTSAKMQLDFLKMILENDGEKQYAPEFKRNLEGLSSCEVLEKQLQLPWYLNSDDSINVNMIQFAAAKGHTEILQLLLDHGLDPEAHLEDSPTAVELAAVNGCVKTFALLKARLQTDSNSEWFQLAQLLVWGMSGHEGNHCHNWKPSEEFKELLGKIPPAKVSQESVCRSALLQAFALAGNRSGVALLLKHGADPTATTVENPKLAERWAFNFNHVGVLAELAKVKDLGSDINVSSLGELVRKEEEREFRKKTLEQKEEEGEWRKKMFEQQEDWQREVIEMLKQQNLLISLLAKNASDAAGQKQDNEM